MTHFPQLILGTYVIFATPTEVTMPLYTTRHFVIQTNIDV